MFYIGVKSTTALVGWAVLKENGRRFKFLSSGIILLRSQFLSANLWHFFNKMITVFNPKSSTNEYVGAVEFGGTDKDQPVHIVPFQTTAILALQHLGIDKITRLSCAAVKKHFKSYGSNDRSAIFIEVAKKIDKQNLNIGPEQSEAVAIAMTSSFIRNARDKKNDG